MTDISQSKVLHVDEGGKKQKPMYCVLFAEWSTMLHDEVTISAVKTDEMYSLRPYHIHKKDAISHLILYSIFTSQGLVIRNLAQTLDISEQSKSRLRYDWCYRLKRGSNQKTVILRKWY
jgi:hypothetical protein